MIRNITALYIVATSLLLSCRSANTEDNLNPKEETVVKCGAYIAPSVWKEFACYNLGATITVDWHNPSAEIHGAKYQWGAFKNEQGRYISQVNDQVSNNNDVPYWVSYDPIKPNYNGKPDGSWSASDPCRVELGREWRVPTKAEWAGVIANNPQRNIGLKEAPNVYATGMMFGDLLFLPTSGIRHNNGALFDRGLYGYYWSSTENGISNAHNLNFNNFNANMEVTNRTVGSSIRCIKD